MNLLKQCACGCEQWYTDPMFTVERGIDVQRKQLALMDCYIKPELMVKLRAHCAEMNKNPKLRCGHDVFRGEDLDTYIRELI